MKIQVIANCQARPVANIVSALMPEVSAPEPIILHLSKPQDAEAQLEQAAKADVILTQLTVDTFQPTHLASSNILSEFKDKTLVWPNIFYPGQQPYLKYFTHPKHGRLFGPLEALHDIRLHKSWQDTGRVQPEAINWSDPDFEAEIREKGLKSLQAKEAECDVTISDFIASRPASDRLFFTFNHPSRLLLTELSRRLLKKLGLKADTPLPQGPEPLARYQVPSTWTQPGASYQGDKVDLSDPNAPTRLGGPPARYSAEELAAIFTAFYDANPIFKDMDGVRLTPNFGPLSPGFGASMLTA